MRSTLKSVSTFLFSSSLALAVLAVAATDTLAGNTTAPAAECAKVRLADVWYCSGTCPQGEYCLSKDTPDGGWICECR